MNDITVSPRKVVLAAAAHPDDIEFMMAGTLVLLKQAGWQVHYLNIANGSCGTATLEKEEIIRIRTGEAREACRELGAVFHEPLVDDLDILYRDDLVRRLCALVRDVKPAILLLQSPQDYMEDHTNSVRLMVTAAFCRGMRNFVSVPPRPATVEDMAVYHALPYGLHDQLRQPILPEFYVDVADVLENKRRLLACHRSQKEWLDVSQGLDSYLNTMTDMSREVGRLSGRFAVAEGWRRHLHLGFGAPTFDPLVDALPGRIATEPRYGGKP